MITGGCLCKAVRYAVDVDAPLAVRTCWCRLCQYLGGGTATVNVCFPADKVTLTGDLSYHGAVADSGNEMRRGFCPACGTPVTSEALARPHLMFFRAGTLDDPSIAAPEATIWTSEKPAWGLVSDAIPSYPAQIPPVA
ncbi:GFA family protein [Sphingomonas sp. ID0503]|uniref:GFA family protein n=1 Tax=Sphingomonas sp. ID0503 TaxID=3399691 RepID=UPI003AFA16DC